MLTTQVDESYKILEKEHSRLQKYKLSENTMKFTEIKEKEALEFINEYQYEAIKNGTATHNTKFNLWIGLCETRGINPTQVTLPMFYK